MKPYSGTILGPNLNPSSEHSLPNVSNMFAHWYTMLETIKDQLVNKFRLVRTRQRRWLLLATIVLTLYAVSERAKQQFQGVHYTFPYVAPFVQELDLDQPPTYERLKKWETDLPQHNLDLPYPEGRTGRYVFFRNQIQMLGWNNQLNEV
jgi:hypothetical protein